MHCSIGWLDCWFPSQETPRATVTLQLVTGATAADAIRRYRITFTTEVDEEDTGCKTVRWMIVMADVCQ